LVVILIRFYTWLIIGYVLLSWFPGSGLLGDIRAVLAGIVEPYLNLFRRFIPPLGMIDISPIVAILVLNAIVVMISRLRF
jgi:YggT family protein